jgi:hypothetical protein
VLMWILIELLSNGKRQRKSRDYVFPTPKHAVDCACLKRRVKAQFSRPSGYSYCYFCLLAPRKKMVISSDRNVQLAHESQSPGPSRHETKRDRCFSVTISFPPPKFLTSYLSPKNRTAPNGIPVCRQGSTYISACLNVSHLLHFHILSLTTQTYTVSSL